MFELRSAATSIKKMNERIGRSIAGSESKKPAGGVFRSGRLFYDSAPANYLELFKLVLS